MAHAYAETAHAYAEALGRATRVIGELPAIIERLAATAPEALWDCRVSLTEDMTADAMASEFPG